MQHHFQSSKVPEERADTKDAEKTSFLRATAVSSGANESGDVENHSWNMLYRVLEEPFVLRHTLLDDANRQCTLDNWAVLFLPTFGLSNATKRRIARLPVKYRWPGGSGPLASLPDPEWAPYKHPIRFLEMGCFSRFWLLFGGHENMKD